ncbi:MAG: sensor histidine kinase [Solirubrobacteraceae bacterium]
MSSSWERLRPAGAQWISGRPHGRSRALPALIWLAFILFPLFDAIESEGPTVGHVLTIAAAAAFVVAYVWLVLTWRRHAWHPLSIGLFAVLIAMAIALTLGNRPDWAFLFIYCSAVAALFSSTRVGWTGVILCAGLAAACSALAGGSAGLVLNYAVTALGIGMLMVLMRDLRVRNEELTEARAELARLAVAQERERFARDLHDLLGHTLSVIALKAELAGRLLPDRPEQAATEVGEVEQVARQALGDVRLAVSGYHQPTLDGELAGARMALSAAGIEADVERAKVALDPDVEAVLAWAVREGATNVIRHSGAGRCTMRVRANLQDAAVEVVDDGSRAAATNGAGGAANGASGQAGTGLAGLGERARAMRGQVEAGVLPAGGFRLTVTVPVSTVRR